MRLCPRCGLQTELAVCAADGATTVAISSGTHSYPPGTVIDGRYRLDSVLGVGGFGTVYRGVQLATEQVVAIKVLRSEHIQSEEHIKRFSHEARAASALRHPNTVRLIDFGSHVDGALYLVMEFLEGETLADRLERCRRLAAEQAVWILRQICHSLSEAHHIGIIHRDLKPENVMLISAPGVEDFVKMLDFGIAARVAKAGASNEKLTEAGMIMGTPAYMSPEQAHGKPLDARSDVYALGVLLYEALTGSKPFDGDDPMNILVRHIHDPPMRPTERAPDAEIPAALERVVLRCLEKDPRHRPASTEELAQELTRALERPDGGLRRGSPEAGGFDPMTEGRTAAIAGMSASPVDARDATGAMQSLAARVAAASTTGERRRGIAPVWVAAGAAMIAVIAVIAVVALTPPGAPVAVAPAAPATREAGASTPINPASLGESLGSQGAATAPAPQQGSAPATPPAASPATPPAQALPTSPPPAAAKVAPAAAARDAVGARVDAARPTAVIPAAPIPAPTAAPANAPDAAVPAAPAPAARPERPNPSIPKPPGDRNEFRLDD